MRARRLDVSEQLLLQLLTSGKPATAVVNGLPADARVVDTRFNPWDRTLSVMIESAAFPEMTEGCEPPQLHPVPRHLRETD